MKKRIATLLLAAALMPAASQGALVQISPCFGMTVWVGHELNARELLAGKTVKVWFYTPESYRADPGIATVKAAPVVRTFSEDSVREQHPDGKSTTRKITYEGNDWCQFDAITVQKKCYTLVLAALNSNKGREVLDAEVIPEGQSFCRVTILGRVEGVELPADAAAPQGSRRRAQ